MLLKGEFVDYTDTLIVVTEKGVWRLNYTDSASAEKVAMLQSGRMFANQFPAVLPSCGYWRSSFLRHVGKATAEHPVVDSRILSFCHTKAGSAGFLVLSLTCDNGLMEGKCRSHCRWDYISHH
jgi:hypothetical protein